MTINTRFQYAPDARHKCGTTMFAFYIGSSGERTLSAKRFVSASLAAPEGSADVTNTKSQRFRRSTIGKATPVTWKDHRKTSRAACLSQELAAENSRGAWARICLFSSTQTASADQLSVHRYERQSGNQTVCFSVPLTCSRPKRSQIIFHCSFPIKLHHIETQDNNRIFTCFPTCSSVSHGPVIVCVISTLKSWSVPSCRVSCCRATTYGVCLQSRLFPRGVVPCPASPCHQTTARSLFSRCHHSPDDVTWWHTVTRHVPVANYISSIQKSNSATRFSHGAT